MPPPSCVAVDHQSVCVAGFQKKKSVFQYSWQKKTPSLPPRNARTHARTHLSSILPVVLECKIFKDANHGKPLLQQNLMAHRHET
jgi:hypothetical protein